MGAEDDRVAVRVEVRRFLREVIQEAQRQGCLEDVRRFPDVLVTFVLQSDGVAEAVVSGMVTIQDICVWLGVLLDGREKHGTASV